jgi:hypothetical protein
MTTEEFSAALRKAEMINWGFLVITVLLSGYVMGCSFALVSLRYDTNKCDCSERRLELDEGNSGEIKAELAK